MPHAGTILRFPGQEADERIFVFVRRYFVAFLPTLLLVVFISLFGIFILGFMAQFIEFNIVLLFGSAYLLFILLFTLVSFFDFYFDLNVVTDRRVIDIEQNRLFSRSVSELLFEDIEDVDSKVNGILETFFDYGDVMIQTAGAKPNFIFEQVHHPNQIAAIILDLSDQQTRGIAVADRHPEGPVAGIIDDRLVPHTPDHLDEL